MSEKKNDEAIMEQAREDTTPEFALDIKYMGKDITLDEDSARQLAQKGMNYDRMYEELMRLRKGAGDMEEEALEEATIPPAKDAPNPADFSGRLDEFSDFFRRHEDVKSMADIPTEAIERIAAGTSIEEAFLACENRMLRDKLTEMESRLKSPGALFNDEASQGDDGFVRMLLAKL